MKTAFWRLLALVTVLAVLCGVLPGCGDAGRDGGFRFPLEREPAQLDPQVSDDASSLAVVSSLYEGLTRLNDAGEPVPGGADWTVSADGLTYTFTLKESYWSTIKVRGEETEWDEPTRVVADDYVFGFQRAIDPKTGSPLATALYGIRNARDIHAGVKAANALGVSASGEDTVIIQLESPDEAFLQKLAAAPFMPCDRAFFHYTNGRYGLEKHYILTNGAFSLTAWNHGESLLLGRHEGYHAADEIFPVAVRFVIGGVKDPVTALKEGNMDALPLTAEQQALAAESGLPILALKDTIRSVYFNTRHATLANASVRRALAYAVEWETVYAFLEERGETSATGYIAPDALVGGEIYRRDTNGRRFSTRLTDARAALGEGLRQLHPEEKNPALPRLTVLAADDEVSANLARYLVQSWQKNLDIYCTLELVAPSALNSRLSSGSYQIAIATVTASGLSGAENLQSYATGGVGNVTGYSDGAFDGLLGAALTGGRQQLAAAEEHLRQTCPSLPLSFPERYYGLSGNVEDVLVRPFYGGAYGSPFAFREAKKWDD